MNFSYNEVRFAGGAVYADESSTTVTADMYNHTLGTGANGACFIRFPQSYGGKVIVLFVLLSLSLSLFRLIPPFLDHSFSFYASHSYFLSFLFFLPLSFPSLSLSLSLSLQSLIYFSNNTATSSFSGNDFHIFNIRSCQQGYFFPSLLRDFIPTVPFNPVVIATDTPLLTTSTGPSYLFFYGASSKCYKTVDEVVFLLPNCSHELLMSK